MIGRALVVVPLALFAAAMVVRTAMVSAYAEERPERAAAVWPGHPGLVFSAGLSELARAAAAGRPVDPKTIEGILAAARKAPLAPEPFLVRGVDAQTKGDDALAVRAFVEARRRDPRSVAARYFLADHYLRAGRIRAGLDEISVLARLVPQSRLQVAPYLAAYARTEGAAPLVKAMLREHPDLEPVLLDSLAADASNADLILGLWSGGRGEVERRWQERLVQQLVIGGHYGRAHALWARFAGKPVRVTDLDYADGGAPPPFGWRLVSGPEGIAEAIGAGQLHLLYYGRQDLVLASRLLLLRPGRYRLAAPMIGTGSGADQFRWALRCLPSKKVVAEIPLAKAGQGAALDIPAGCQAQQLELAARAPEFPEQADVTIGRLELQGAGR